MFKFKLQVRIALLIFVLSFLFIYVFTSIQIRNQIEKLNSYNNYRARVGTIIVKTTLDLLLKDTTSEESLPAIFSAAIDSFSNEGIVEKISVISIDGKPFATNDPIVQEFGETEKDIESYIRLSQAAGKDTWYYSTINQKTKIIDIFIPLVMGESTRFIVKLSFSIGNIHEAVVSILVPIILTIVVVIIGNLILGFIILRSVVWPINVLNSATKDIASGNLDLRVRIDTKDEIQELGDTFNEMAVALRKMKDRAENANPLTKLPGNNIIREEIESRIKKQTKFVAIHVDLDHFKAYNDRYGIGKGDEVIRFTSEVLENGIKKKGNRHGDFIGHEGGDDFFVITTPDKADAVTSEIIAEFDAKIRAFYSEEDLRLGYILEKDRRGELVKFPIMTITLAGVTNQIRPISSYGELTNIAVGVKHMAKMVTTSNFLLDRRTSPG
ncbi:MAG: diguanylate cyclase [Candidatus Omnitrophota bacterium]|jgi:diguanylate cyclase (GGDEF)-like protein